MRRSLVIPALLLPLALLSACGQDEPAPAPAPQYQPAETPDSTDPEMPEEKPTVDEPAPSENAALLPFSEAPETLTTGDLTERETAWLADLEKLKAHPELQSDGEGSGGGGFAGGSSYGVDEELQVSYSNTETGMNLTATTDSGEGVAYDAETKQNKIVRLYEVSPESQAHIDTLVPALENWKAKTGEWPSAGWDMFDDQWVLEPGTFDESKAKPVVLDLPESFDANGYTFMGDSGHFDFVNEDTDETIRLMIEDNKFAGVNSTVAIPVM